MKADLSRGGDLLAAFETMFSAKEGKTIYAAATKALRENGGEMGKMLAEGTLVGFSGGADSVMLLGFLALLHRRTVTGFPLLAVHIHHGIRGQEADGDEAFARSVAEALGVEFLSLKKEIPALARARKTGWEETARDVRYSCFQEILRGRNDLHTIALAHNATDQVETVLLFLLRGAGGDGLCGIAPVRDRVVRPLLSVPAEKIRSALGAAGIPYRIDSTNADVSYRRNRIRLRVLPELRRICSSPENAVTRAVCNLGRDRAFFAGEAAAFLAEYPDGAPAREAMARLHPAVLFRVIVRLCEPHGIAPTEAAVREIAGCLARGGDFRVSLPASFAFVARGGFCRIASDSASDFAQDRLMISLPFGQNNRSGFFAVDDYSVAVLFAEGDLAAREFALPSENVYKIAIQADLSSAIIRGDLFVRSRKDGDCYFYKGMTHKIKKLCNDKKIPPALRTDIPVFCDEAGIVWIPGFGVRDDGGHTPKFIVLYEKIGSASAAATASLSQISRFRGVIWKHDGAGKKQQQKGMDLFP